MANSTTYETIFQITVRAADAEQADRLAAEAYAAGATGLEERERENEITRILYAPTAVAEAVRDAIESSSLRVRHSGPAFLTMR